MRFCLKNLHRLPLRFLAEPEILVLAEVVGQKHLFLTHRTSGGKTVAASSTGWLGSERRGQFLRHPGTSSPSTIPV